MLRSMCLVFLALATVVPKPTDVVPAENQLEQGIRELFEALRDVLKNGVPEQNIPPQDPLHIPEYSYDFYLIDTSVEGSFKNVLASHISDFNQTEVRFTLFPGIKLSTSLYFDVLNITSRYNVDGTLLNIYPVHGTGYFNSSVQGLMLNLLVDMTEKNGSLFIRNLDVSFTLEANKFMLTNERDENGDWYEVENIIEILYEIQEKYFRTVLNTLTLVANDLLVGVTPGDIINLIPRMGGRRASTNTALAMAHRVLPYFLYEKK